MMSIHIKPNKHTSKLSILLHNGYRYQCNRITKGFIYWKCWIRSCRAPAKTTGAGEYVCLLIFAKRYRFLKGKD